MNESTSPKRNGQKTGPAQPPHPQPQLFHPAPRLATRRLLLSVPYNLSFYDGHFAHRKVRARPQQKDELHSQEGSGVRGF